MKRQIVLTEFFPPENGGIQNALKLLLQSAGPETTVVAPPQMGTEVFDRQQPYQVIRRSLFSSRLRPRWSWLISWLWSQRQALVVFGHLSAAVMAARLLKPLGLHYAVLLHGQDILSESRRPGRRNLVALTLRGADWIGVNSQFTGQVAQGFGVYQSRIVLTHPAVPDKLVTSVSRRSGARIITICRLVERKNVRLVLEAVQQLQADIPELHLDVVGDGPERARLETQALDLGLHHRVTFHGWVSETQKLALLDRANLFVMVPKALAGGSDVEGLGIVYLEAAARELPIVASRSGGIEDIVRDQQTGRLVDPESLPELVAAIRSMLKDAHQAQQYAKQAQARVKDEFVASVRNQRWQWLVDPVPQAQQAKVSVVIPVYNHANTIGRTLTALKQQTWPNIETIVVNDGSTDNLKTVLDPWLSTVRYVDQRNQGAPVARNTGAARASGKYILFLDADTWLHPRMIEAMVTVLATHPTASWAYSRFRFGPKGFRLHEFSAAALRRQNYIHTSSLIRREHFIGFDPSLKRFQDWDLWLRMSAQDKTGIFIPQELFRVSQGRGGMKASAWLPKFMYRLPGIGRGRGNQLIQRYRQAESIVRAKHGLD